MSFDPLTGGPCYLADIRRGATRQIAQVLRDHEKWKQPMTEGVTCYERDEQLCEDQMCLRTGCRIRNERLKSETDDIGEIVRELRRGTAVEGSGQLMDDAADALERLSAERDAWVAQHEVALRRRGEIEARLLEFDKKLREAVDLLEDLLGLVRGSGEKALAFIQAHDASAAGVGGKK